MSQTVSGAGVRRGAIAARLGDAVDAGSRAALRCSASVAMVAHVCVNRSAQARAGLEPWCRTSTRPSSGRCCSAIVVFGDVPDGFMLAGAAIIIGAGLFIFLRERSLARRASFSEPPP